MLSVLTCGRTASILAICVICFANNLLAAAESVLVAMSFQSASAIRLDDGADRIMAATMPILNGLIKQNRHPERGAPVFAMFQG